jgi:hypothetical protein
MKLTSALLIQPIEVSKHIEGLFEFNFYALRRGDGSPQGYGAHIYEAGEFLGAVFEPGNPMSQRATVDALLNRCQRWIADRG